ncbi:flagellar hook-basal body protein [Baekduia soli]|uniref:Flagellar hook-basal body protein n=1 Tax=Baekduia soli TaxID=496014 RepID=A0A5B8U192_9ACTN|nr:flagellar hook-basal body protein [Baekduia soli]QEC46824.1 flagellar hook-basal body protein [Baekduia soli]
MERGLYIAAAGMVAEMARQDQIANDLANAATPGYKSDRSVQRSFGDLLLQNTKTGQTVGPLGAGPLITKTVTDLTPEGLRDTGQPLDLAVSGEGYFAIKTANGVRYTRDGSFQAAPDRTLVDASGQQVLGTDRQPVKLSADGTVDVKKVGCFALTGVTKQGDSLFSGTAGSAAATGTVVSGGLESSGVDAARTMVDMMASLRAFEAGQKAIQTIDQSLQQAAGQVGNLPG